MRDALIKLAMEAWTNKTINKKLSFSPTEKLKETISELFGHKIEEVFITSNGIRHLRNHHGEGEEKRGQINFTPDMAGEIYDTVNNFDVITKERNDNLGNQNVLVMKKGGGNTFVVLTERGKKRVEIKTFYKKRPH